MDTPPSARDATPPKPNPVLGSRRRLYDETEAMLEAALARGKEVPANAVNTVEAFSQVLECPEPIPADLAAAMVTTHHVLALSLAPATPRTIELLRRERNVSGWKRLLGPIDLIRQLMLAAITSLALFIAFCASDATDSPPRKMGEAAGATYVLTATAPGASATPPKSSATPIGTGTANASAAAAVPTSNSPAGAVRGVPVGSAEQPFPQPHRTIMNMDGYELIMNVGMWLAAAGIGASFVCLYKANRYVMEGTFDPMYVGSYWIRFFLGLISGLMLAAVVNEDLFTGNTIFEPRVIRVPLAIVGGFSAELFYTFLARFVDACKSLFQGAAEEMVKTEVERARVRLAGAQLQNQIQLATRLVQIQREIGANPNPDEVKKQLDDLLKQVLPPQSGGTGAGGGSAP